MNLALAADGFTIGYWIGAVIGAIGVGLICGLAPLAAGALTQQKRLGSIGFGSCIVGGVIAGAILAVPIAVIFSIVIVVKWNKASGGNDRNSTPGPRA